MKMPQKSRMLLKGVLLCSLIFSGDAAFATDAKGHLEPLPTVTDVKSETKQKQNDSYESLKEKVKMDTTANATALPEAYRAEHNGVMRMYNMFPRSYKNIDAMTADLERVRDMGFTHVWLNPIHTPTDVEKKKWPEGTPNGLKGSLYAMKDPYQINPDFSVVKRDENGKAYETNASGEKVYLRDADVTARDQAALKRFTKKATELGMVPMFDLVLSHIAPDSAIVDGTHPKFAGVDTKPWFARWPSGKPKLHGLDEQGNILPEIKYPDKEVWDDVVMFDYHDPKVRKEITEKLWKPFVQQFFDAGFMGIRVDSVANNNADVMTDTLTYFSEKHKEKYGVAPTIIGESLGGTIEAQSKISPLATHIYNSAYWVPNNTGPNIGATPETAKQMWSHDDNWYQQEMGQKQALIFRDKSGQAIEGRKGGTVGYAGSHDELPWVLQFPAQLPPMNPHMADEVLFRAPSANFGLDAKAATIGVREKIANAALTSDGGWFITSFDDKLDTTLRSVFDKHSTGQQLGDLSPFIKELNSILNAQPVTQFGSWSKRHFLEGRDELVIVQRHTGFGHAGPKNLIILNADPEKDVKLTPAELVKLAEKTGRSVDDFFADKGEKGVWLGKGVEAPTREELQSHVVQSKTFSARILRARERLVEGFGRQVG